MKTKIEEILRQYELAKQLEPFTVQPWLDGKPCTYDAQSSYVQEFILSEPLARTGEDWLLPYAVAAGFGHGWAGPAVGQFLRENFDREIYPIEVMKAATEDRLDSIGTLPSLSGATGTGRVQWKFEDHPDGSSDFEISVTRPGDRKVVSITRDRHNRWSAYIVGQDLAERHVGAALKVLDSLRFVDGVEFEELGLGLVEQAAERGLSVGALINGAEWEAELGSTTIRERSEECGNPRPSGDEYTIFTQTVVGEPILSDQNEIFLEELSSSSEIIRYRRADGGTEFYSG